MDTIDIQGRKIKIRPLTRGEIKSLKKYGFSVFGCLPTMDQANEAQEECFKLVLAEGDSEFLDTCPNKDGVKIWKEIIKETYGASDEEKNSQSTSAGSTIKKE